MCKPIWWRCWWSSLPEFHGESSYKIRTPNCLPQRHLVQDLIWYTGLRAGGTSWAAWWSFARHHQYYYSANVVLCIRYVTSYYSPYKLHSWRVSMRIYGIIKWQLCKSSLPNLFPAVLVLCDLSFHRFLSCLLKALLHTSQVSPVLGTTTQFIRLRIGH